MALYTTISDSPITFSALKDVDDDPNSLLLKIAAIGDTSTGKTAMLKTVADNHYIEDFYLTSVNYYKISFSGSHHRGAIEMHDIPSLSALDDGQKLSVYDIDVFLLCFAVDSTVSFEHLRQQLVAKVRTMLKSQHIPLVLVGLRGDARSDDKTASVTMVSVDDAIRFAKEIRAVAYLECSSLTGKGLHVVFETAVNAALRHRFHKKCTIM